MNVTLQEVGLTGGSGIYGVGEPTRTSTSANQVQRQRVVRGSIAMSALMSPKGRTEL